MWIIYNAGIYIYFILLLPYYLVNLLFREKYRAGLFSRFSMNAARVAEACQGTKTMWFHAVSVGEVLAVLPLIDAVQAKYPDYMIVLSTTTLASNRLAAARVSQNKIQVIYFPLDFTWAVRRMIDAVHPELIVLTETELWPNFLRCARQCFIPVVLVNGRISPASFKSYYAIRRFFCDFVQGITIFGMQSELYRDNIVKLGVDPSRVVIAGNLKYEAMGRGQEAKPEPRGLRSELGIPPDSVVIFGGSTHQGEEEILLDHFVSLRKKRDHVFLCLAPRHIERVQGIVGAAQQRGLRIERRSALQRAEHSPYDVMVLDTIGELSRLYATADVVFVGKSLSASGGQNILEPARWGKAVVFGPHMDNFQDEARVLIDGGGAVQVQDAAALGRVLDELTDDADRMKRMGASAAAVVDRYRGGVLEKNLSIIATAMQ